MLTTLDNARRAKLDHHIDARYAAHLVYVASYPDHLTVARIVAHRIKLVHETGLQGRPDMTY